MASNRRIFHRRRFSLHLLLLSAAVFWSALWLGGVWQLQRQVGAFMERERGKGHNFTMESSRCGGSPLAITRHIKGLVWSFGERGSLKAKDLRISLRPWNWLAYEASFQESVEISFSGSKTENAFYLQSPHAIVNISLPLIAPKSYRRSGLTLGAQAERIAIKTSKTLPFGNAIAKAGIELRVMGSLPDFADKNSVSAWNANSGVIEVDSSMLAWGLLNLTLNGTLALDSNLQPEGAFSGALRNRAAAVKALADGKWISKNDAVLLNAALDATAKDNGQSGQKAEAVAVTAQNGELYLGPVRVMTLPSLTWK